MEKWILSPEKLQKFFNDINAVGLHVGTSRL